jgi:hypothetical protein
MGHLEVRPFLSAVRLAAAAPAALTSPRCGGRLHRRPGYIPREAASAPR